MDSKHDSMRRFVGILRREKYFLQRLLAVTEEEKEAIVGRRMARLEEIVLEKRGLISALKGLEEERLGLHAELAEFHGYSQDAFSLSILANLAGREESAFLRELGREIRELHDRLSVMDRRVRQLLETGLGLVRSLIAHIQAQSSEQSVYFRTGSLENPGGRGRLLSSSV